MFFRTKKEFLLFIRSLKEIGSGSQGICYLDKRINKVYKVFHQFFDVDDEFLEYFHKYTKEEILKFSNIDNSTFIWSNDVIIVDNEIVGYVSDYVNARPLYKINPLSVSLNHFSQSVNMVEKDIKIISDNKVISYDVVYNILYGRNGIKIIDHDDYSFSNLDSEEIYNANNYNFNIGIMYFLIDGYFDEFISMYSILEEMYKSKGININEFIILFREKLSEVVGDEISKLEDASSCLNKNKKRMIQYQRNIFEK